jgi:hypothetical protein
MRKGGQTMSIEDAIEQFCSIGSRIPVRSEPSGNLREHIITTDSRCSHYSQQDTQKILQWFVAKCSADLNVKPQDVIDGLLSPENEQEIINGLVSEIELRVYIETWIKDGMPRYSLKPY